MVAKTEPLKNPAMPQLDDIATIVYTSGSTGKPKGVLHSFRTMIVITSGMEEIWGFTSNERMLSYLPLAHVAERAAVETMSLYFGFHVFLLRRFRNLPKRFTTRTTDNFLLCAAFVDEVFLRRQRKDAT
jgi:long-subunit acyl-CoA synthetase (AMP-forming)